MPDGVQKELPPQQLNNVIRMIKTSSLERVSSVRAATFAALRRLRAHRDRSKAVTGLPPGSDQNDVGSLVSWMGRVKRGDHAAVGQIVAIDATAVARVEG